MAAEFVSGLLVWKKMSNGQTQQNRSLVGGSATEGLENAAVGPARSITCSGLSYAAPNVSGSRQLSRKTAKTTSEWRTSASTIRTAQRSTPQFLGTLSGSYANLQTARRASSATPLMYTNSSRKRTQLQQSAPGQVPTKWQRELEHVRQQRTDLADHQHCYAAERIEAGRRRAFKLQKAEKDRENDEEIILETDKEVAERC